MRQLICRGIPRHGIYAARRRANALVSLADGLRSIISAVSRALPQASVGNIHVTSLVPDNMDLMICYHHAQQPIHLDPDLYERVTLGTEFLRPYASEALVAKGGASLPGRASHPVPLLMYSPGVYFARLVDLIQENTPIFGVRVIESDMSDVLCGIALGGRGYCLVNGGHRGGLWPEAADPDRRRQVGVVLVFSCIQGSNA